VSCLNYAIKKWCNKVTTAQAIYNDYKAGGVGFAYYANSVLVNNTGVLAAEVAWVTGTDSAAPSPFMVPVVQGLTVAEAEAAAFNAQLRALFDKKVPANDLMMGGKIYTATVESNTMGHIKVFDTSAVNDVQLEQQVRAFANQITGGMPLTAVSGSPTNIWAAKLPDGTIVNVRTHSTSKISRWTVDIISSPNLEHVTYRPKMEIKFK
jgi:hypothetical protein